jgi:hypothetical protein
MIIFGRREYSIIMVTFMVSVLTRMVLDTYMFNVVPYGRDIFYDIWQGKFLYDKYWLVLMTALAAQGYMWGKFCEGHLSVISNRGDEERKKGSLCYRIFGF